MTDKELSEMKHNVETINQKLNFLIGGVLDTKFSPATEEMSDEELADTATKMADETEAIQKETDEMIERNEEEIEKKNTLALKSMLFTKAELGFEDEDEEAEEEIVIEQASEVS